MRKVFIHATKDGQIRRYAGSSSGLGNVGVQLRTELTPRLVAALQRLGVGDAEHEAEKDRVSHLLLDTLNGVTHDDDFEPAAGGAAGNQEGHPFYGNQYTDVAGLGPKPTTAKAKGIKAATHELLSSGHPFSLEELMKATGVDNPKMMVAYLGDLKNPKYAHKAGVLDIVKNKTTGHYQVVKKAAEAAVAPAPKKEEPKPATEEMPGTVKPLLGGSDSAHADMLYTAAVTKAALGAVKLLPPYELDEDEEHELLLVAAKQWKQQKVKAQAQWHANNTGKETPVLKVTEVFPEDIDFIKDFAEAFGNDGDGLGAYKKANAKWKKATQEAKIKKMGPALEPSAELLQKLGAEVSKYKAAQPKEPEPIKLKSTPAASTTIAQSSLVPKGWKGVQEGDFKPLGKFHKNNAKLTTALNAGPEGSEFLGGDVSEKAPIFKKQIEAALHTELLETSPEYKTLDALLKTGPYKSQTIARKLVAAWASSSGDSHPLSCAMQSAVARKFDMHVEHVETAALTSLQKNNDEALHASALTALLGTAEHNSLKLISDFKKAAEDFVGMQYKHTQAMLKHHGITEVSVIRGMTAGENATSGSKPEKVKLKLQPASSFSTSLSTAKSFAGTQGKSKLYFATIPASQVLSSFRTGYGCTGEKEVVVLNHPDTFAMEYSVNPYDPESFNALGKLSEALAHIHKKAKIWE
jgi:hypothetical protein